MAGNTGYGGNTTRRVASGERMFMPSAQTWNSMMDAIESSRRGARDFGHPWHDTDQSGIVLIQNNSGATVDRFGILGIDGPLNAPDSEADPDPFLDFTPMLSGVTPDIDLHRGRFAILLEGLGDGEVGPAVVSGICQVIINVADETTTRTGAEIVDAQSGYLAARHHGSATILYREGGTGEQWAIVKLGSWRPAAAFPVTLTKADPAGSQGTASTAASWLYDVADAVTGETLAEDVDPTGSHHLWRRPTVGQMVQATAGLAYWNANDELVITWINEVADQEACGA
jgi:hypothetical protein